MHRRAVIPATADIEEENALRRLRRRQFRDGSQEQRNGKGEQRDEKCGDDEATESSKKVQQESAAAKVRNVRFRSAAQKYDNGSTVLSAGRSTENAGALSRPIGFS